MHNIENPEIPQDRTLKTPSAAFCRNPECRTAEGEFEFEVEHEQFECPKCGANREPMIGMLVLTHLLIRKKGGPIRGSGGLGYQLACDDKRAYIATVTNLEAATDNPHIANCPRCMETLKKLGVKKPTGNELVLTPPTKTNNPAPQK